MARPSHRHWDHLHPLIQTLPQDPGVYQFYDERGTILYVGKAKNLKKRVSSYFNRNKSDHAKIRVMVRRVADIRHIVVGTELDALLLENNLIKKYQPRYNVLLKDDKTFPWICIKNEPFPRIFATRNLIRDGSRYYGPYASVKTMYALLELIRKLFQYRTCRLNLSEAKIAEGKYRRCLQYHIGNCKAPCEGLQTPRDYGLTIESIENILKGNLATVLGELKQMMRRYSDSLEFEKAGIVREKLELLEKFQSKSMVVSASIHNVDVYTIVSDEDNAYVNFLKVVNGCVVQSHTMEIKKRLNEDNAELLVMAIIELRQQLQSNAPEILVREKPGVELSDARFGVPKRGDKLRLLELSERNATYFQMERSKQRELVDPERHTKRILEQLKKDLRLSKLPDHIECFDNSNIQGTHPVAAMVVFRNARPSKKEYRHYNIKSVTGANDYASMEEVVYRRYKRLMEEGAALPGLVVVDGGKGQLGAALKAITRLNLRESIPLVGIAKRLEEIYFPGDPLPLYIDKKSESLKLIQFLRDEAHRFGLGHHRQKRSKAALQSILTEIKGIGPKTIEQLLKSFGSVEGIKNASVEQLASVAGQAKAVLVSKAIDNMMEGLKADENSM